jgi:hypothetical protein
MPISRDAFSWPDDLVFLARLHVRLGDNDSAFELLDRLFAIPAGNVISPALLNLDPNWDPLRNDQRFQALIKQGNGGNGTAPNG